MSEHDPLLALGGLIDEPVAPRAAFAEALRAQLIAELGSDARSSEKERPVMHLIAPSVTARRLDSHPRTRRQRLMMLCQVAAVAAIAVGLIAALSSGRWDRTDSPTPASNSIQAMAPVGTPSPSASPSAETGLLWRVDSPEDSKDLFRIAVANDSLYRVVSDAYGSPVVSAIDTATGEVRWTKVIDSASGGIAADANGVYLTDLFGNETGSVVALDPATGEQRWSAEAGYAAYALMLGDGVIYVWNEANELVAIDSLTGEIVWNRPLSVGDSITTSSKGVRLFQGPAVLGGTTIAVGALDGTIAAIDVSGAPGGETLWSRTYSEEISFGFGISGDVIATVLSSSNIDLPASSLEAVDRASGATIWRHDLGIAGTLLTAQDAFVIAHSASNPTPSGAADAFVLSAYDPATGDERWNLPDITPLQVSSDGTIIFGTTTDEHFLVAISASDGQVLGSLALDKAFYGPVVADEQAVYGRDWSNATVAYSMDALLNGRIPEAPSSVATPRQGNGIDWISSPTNQSPTGLEFINDGAIAADGGMVFRYVRVEGFDTVEALDATTGTGLWQTPFAPAQADGMTSGLGFVAAQNGNVFAVSGFLPNTTAKLYALDRATGEILWTADVGEAPGIPMIGQDRVYVWSDRSTLFAFDISTGALKWQRTVTGAVMDGYTPRIDEGSQQVIYTPSLLVDQNVYVSTENGSLAVIGVSNLSNGATIGSFFNEGGYVQSMAVSSDVIAFVIASTSTETAQVVALNRWDLGAGPIWEKSFEHGVGKLISSIEGGFLITHGTGNAPGTPTSTETVDFVTTAYDAFTGQERWNLQHVAPSTTTNDGQIVIGMNEQGQLFAIRANDSQILGMLDLGIPGTTFATTDGTRIYVPTNDATIYAVRLDALLNGRTPEMATPIAGAMQGTEVLR